MSKENRQTIHIQRKRTNNTMIKERTHNTMSKEKGQTIQCPKKKDKQYNVQRKRTNNTMTKERTHNTIHYLYHYFPFVRNLSSLLEYIS